MQVKEFLGRYRQKSQPYFDELTKRLLEEAKSMGAVPEYVVKCFTSFYAEGKRIRGALTELGYQIGGGTNEEEILRASLAMEMLQAGFLVQDDFMDRDETRRGLPTLYMSVAKELGGINSEGIHLGNCMAVNMGDVSFFWMSRILSESNFNAEDKVAAIQELSRRVIMVGYGQMLDVANSGEHKITDEEVTKVHRYKTAEYTGSLPLYIGALLTGVKDKKLLRSFQDYGLALGWAFQIQDDILGIFGNSEETGKGVGTDLREGRNTLFMTYLRKSGNRENVNFIESLRGRDLEQKDLDKAKDVFKESGVLEKVEMMKNKYAEDAVKVVSQMKTSEEYKDTLINLVEFVTSREN